MSTLHYSAGSAVLDVKCHYLQASISGSTLCVGDFAFVEVSFYFYATISLIVSCVFMAYAFFIFMSFDSLNVSNTFPKKQLIDESHVFFSHFVEFCISVITFNFFLQNLYLCFM